MDQNGLSIRPMEHGELQQLVDFIKEFWSESHIFVSNPKLFDWQHKGSDRYHAIVAVKDERIVGIDSFIPQSHFDPKLPTNQIFLTLWGVDEMSGIATGFRLFRKIIDEYQPQFIGSLGMTQKTIDFHKWQKFHVAPMNHHVIFSPYVTKFDIAKVSEEIYVQEKSIQLNHHFSEITNEELLELNSTSLYGFQTPMKSNQFIVERYFEHPTYRYKVFALKDADELLSLSIVRPIKQGDAVVLRFVDYVGTNESLTALYPHLLNLLKQYGAEYIDLYSYGIPLHLLEEAGFQDRSVLEGVVVPNYFEPFVQQNVDMNCAYKLFTDELAPVRIFKGDSDQDRPNISKKY